MKKRNIDKIPMQPYFSIQTSLLVLSNLFPITNSLAFRNLKAHCRQDKHTKSSYSGKCLPITLITYFLQIPKDVILSPNIRLTTWTLPLWFSYKKLVCLSPPPPLKHSYYSRICFQYRFNSCNNWLSAKWILESFLHTILVADVSEKREPTMFILKNH